MTDAITLNAPTNSLVIRIWPDNTWAIKEDIRDGEYDWKSDDYQDLDLYDYTALATFSDRRLLDEITSEVMG